MTYFLGAATYTVTRNAAGAYTNGVWVDGAPSTFPADASVQPLTGRDRELLAEGARARGRLVAYTESVLQIVDPDTQTRGDRLTYKGRSYEVIARLDWEDHTSGLPHNAYVLAEVTDA